jgi:hypothetical protein
MACSFFYTSFITQSGFRYPSNHRELFNHYPGFSALDHYKQEAIPMIQRLFNDPRLFVYIIMTLYFCSAVRFAVAKNWPDAGYWLCALGLTIIVTFLKH